MGKERWLNRVHIAFSIALLELSEEIQKYTSIDFCKMVDLPVFEKKNIDIFVCLCVFTYPRRNIISRNVLRAHN